MSGKPTLLLREEDPRAEPFDYAGGPDAALLVHGFTGTPAEMLPVGDFLSKQYNWRCVCPLLPGHGTTYQDLEKYKAEDWIKAVETTWMELSKQHKRIHLVGLSMGALLSLELFRRHPTAFQSIVLLAPAVILRTWVQRFLSSMARYPFIYSWVPPVDKETPGLPDHVAYHKYTPRASGEFARVYMQAQTLESMQAPPTLIISSRTDEVVHIKSGTFLKNRLLNPQTKLVILERSTHVVTLGESKEIVLQEMTSFYQKLMPIRLVKA